MTALPTLEPRDAGIEPVEPSIAFDASLDELHRRVACQYTAFCVSSTDVCYTTG